MQRVTISIDDDLAADFEALIETRNYGSRSEAVRDLVRRELRQERVKLDPETPCVGTLTYVYDHHDRTTAMRLQDMQHEHHGLTVSALHAHLAHELCIETIILRGPASALNALANAILAERGVRHGHLHLIA